MQTSSFTYFSGLAAVNLGTDILTPGISTSPVGGAAWWLLGFQLSSACYNLGTGTNDIVNLAFGVNTGQNINCASNQVFGLHSYLYTGTSAQNRQSVIYYRDQAILIQPPQMVTIYYGTVVDSGLAKQVTVDVAFFWEIA